MKNKPILKSFLFWLILGLFLIRLLALFLALNNFPPTNPIKDQWLFAQGGDETGYFEQAKAIINGQNPGRGLIGFPLLLAPLVWLSNPEAVADLAKPVALLYGVFFYVLVSLFVYFLAKKFLKKRSKAIVVTAFFNLYPYLIYYFLYFASPQNLVLKEYRISRFLQLMFFLALSDPLSTTLVLACLLLLFKIFKKAKPSMPLALLLGFLASWACITRLQLGLVAVFFGVVLLLDVFRKKSLGLFARFKNVIFYSLGFLPLFIIQLLVNLGASGSLIGLGYQMQKGDNHDIPMISLKYVLNLFIYPARHSPILLLPLALGLVLLTLGVYKLVKQEKSQTWLLLGYFSAIVLPLLFVEAAMRNPRYFLPAIPVIFILLYLGLEQIIYFFKKKRYSN